MSKEALQGTRKLPAKTLGEQPAKKRPLNGVRSAERPHAAEYNAFGQKTSQGLSHFRWWMAIDESEGDSRGTLMDFPSVISTAQEVGEIHIIGEANSDGRITNQKLIAKNRPNGAVAVVIEDNHTEVILYPNLQITPRAEIIHNYWFVEEDGKNLTLAEAQKSGYCNGNQNERLLKIHGLLTDNRETNVAVTHIVDFAGTGSNSGSYLAVGAGQRYIIRDPADKPTIQAWQARNSRATATA